MYLLVNCSDPIYSVFLFPLKKIMNIIMIIAPILLIISLTVVFIRGIANPDDKKLISRIKNSIIAVMCVFLVSCITSIVMSILGSTTDITACWNNSKKTTITNEYINEIGEQERKPVVTDKSKYKNDSNNEENSIIDISQASNGSEAINLTAKSLAWPLGTSSSTYKSKPTTAYKIANANYILPRMAKSQRDYRYAKGMSCCIFVTTVIRASGYDNSFPYCVEKSKNYASKSSKWKQVSIDSIVAGDILLYKNNNHIFMYGGTGTKNGKKVHIWYTANLNKDYGHTYTTTSKSNYKSNCIAFHATK